MCQRIRRAVEQNDTGREDMECDEWANLLRLFKQGIAILGRVVGAASLKGAYETRRRWESDPYNTWGKSYNPPRAPYSTKTPVPYSHPWGPIGRVPLAS